MTIQQLSSANWNDFVSLMQTDAQFSECWCLNHREPAGCPTGAAAQTKMQQLTTEKKVGGLLAYQDQKCVGWVAIDPMTELVGHDCQPSGKPNEWVIVREHPMHVPVSKKNPTGITIRDWSAGDSSERISLPI